MKKATESITFLVVTFGWLNPCCYAEPMPSGPDSIYLIDNTKEEDFSLHFERPSWNHWLLMDLTVAK